MSPHPDIGRLILGTWGISASNRVVTRVLSGYGAISDEAAQRVLQSAWDAGIRLLDTAPSYGAGFGYERIARFAALTGNRFSVIVKPGRRLIGDHFESFLETRTLLAEIHRGELILGKAQVALVKDPPAEAAFDGRLERTLFDLAAALPDKTIGLATHIPEIVESASGFSFKGILMTEYNVANQILFGPPLERLKTAGWEIWGMQPLAYGFLGGRIGKDTVFGVDDFRHQLPKSARETLALMARTFSEMVREVAPDVALSTAAIAFCLAAPWIDRIAIGPKSKEQLDADVEALDLVRDPNFLALVNRICNNASQ